MFPFNVKYSYKLSDSVQYTDYAEILECINVLLNEKKVNIKFIDDHQVTYAGSSANVTWKGDFALSVDKGIFTIVERDSELYLVYEIYLHELFIFSVLASFIFGLISGQLWVGVAAFSWLGGMNWLISFFRHLFFFDEIKAKVDGLIAGSSKPIYKLVSDRELSIVTISLILVIVLSAIVLSSV